MFYHAEVLEVIYNDTNPELLYGIKCKIKNLQVANDPNDPTVITAIPINYNNITMPIKGEVVLLIQAPSSSDSGLKSMTRYYYVDVVSLQSSIHHNSLPTITKLVGSRNEDIPISIDDDFQEQSSIKPLQPYVGDMIWSSRYGTSLRFTTTPKSGNFTVQPNFSKAEGKPILILRNTTQALNTGKINDFTTEDFENEENVLVLASGQQLKFKQSSDVLSATNSKSINSWKNENFGDTPQILLSSGRIILNSTRKEIQLFAKNGIGLSSESHVAIDSAKDISLNSNKIELGLDADQSLILGDLWKSWTENLIQALSTLIVITPAGPSSPLSASPQWLGIELLKAQLPSLLSDSVFTKKKIVMSPSAPSRLLKINEPDFRLSQTETETAQALKEEANQIAETEDLTEDEKATFIDFSNKNEKELIEGQRINSQIETGTVTSQDIDDTNITEVLYSGLVQENEGQEPEFEDQLDESTISSDFEWEYDFVSSSNTSTNKTDKLIIQSLSEDSKNLGTKAAKLSLLDEGITENPIGSRSGQRIDEYLSNINCRSGKAEWGVGAVATWIKEAGLPTPTSNISSAGSWYQWAKETNRFCSSPCLGAIAVYGVKNQGIINVQHLGLVIQCLDNNAVITMEGNIDYAVAQVYPRNDALLGFILPSTKDLEMPTVSYKEEDDNSKETDDDFTIYKGIKDGTSADAIRFAHSVVFSNVAESKSYCARYTFNLAWNYVHRLRNQPTSIGVKYNAGGNSNSPQFHDNLQKLGYTMSKQYSVDKKDLKSWLSTKDFGLGDVVVYWCTKGSIKTNPSLYGHAQIFTGRLPVAARSAWASDMKWNFNASFVYNSSTSKDAQFTVIHFQAPIK